MERRKYDQFNYVFNKKFNNYRFCEYFMTENQLVCSCEMTHAQYCNRNGNGGTSFFFDVTHNFHNCDIF